MVKRIKSPPKAAAGTLCTSGEKTTTLQIDNENRILNLE